MSWKTMIALTLLVFNSLFLCTLFFVLLLQGECLIFEHNPWIAGFEVLVTLSTAALGVERLLRIRERKMEK